MCVCVYIYIYMGSGYARLLPIWGVHMPIYGVCVCRTAAQGDAHLHTRTNTNIPDTYINRYINTIQLHIYIYSYMNIHIYAYINTQIHMYTDAYIHK